MNRKTTTLLSLGLSVALIAAGIWILYNHQNSFGYGDQSWHMPSHMMVAGVGMGIVVFFFWVALLSAVGLVISGIISSRRTSRHTEDEILPNAHEILQHNKELKQHKGVTQ